VFHSRCPLRSVIRGVPVSLEHSGSLHIPVHSVGSALYGPLRRIQLGSPSRGSPKMYTLKGVPSRDPLMGSNHAGPFTGPTCGDPVDGVPSRRASRCGPIAFFARFVPSLESRLCGPVSLVYSDSLHRPVHTVGLTQAGHLCGFHSRGSSKARPTRGPVKMVPTRGTLNAVP
jgi:hypothetical protein